MGIQYLAAEIVTFHPNDSRSRTGDLEAERLAGGVTAVKVICLAEAQTPPSAEPYTIVVL